MVEEAVDYVGQWPLVFFAILGAVLVAWLALKIYNVIMSTQERITKEQREWQTVQNKGWQDFLNATQQRADESARQNNEVQRELIKQINGLTIAIEKHDNFTRAKMVRYDSLADAILTEEREK